jgi:hypothetical protein
VGEIEDALARAAADTATRPIPKSGQAQMRFLLKAEKGFSPAPWPRPPPAAGCLRLLVDGRDEPVAWRSSPAAPDPEARVGRSAGADGQSVQPSRRVDSARSSSRRSYEDGVGPAW